MKSIVVIVRRVQTDPPNSLLCRVQTDTPIGPLCRVWSPHCGPPSSTKIFQPLKIFLIQRGRSVHYLCLSTFEVWREWQTEWVTQWPTAVKAWVIFATKNIGTIITDIGKDFTYCFCLMFTGCLQVSAVMC